VAMYMCDKCGGKFNYYRNTAGRGKPEFYIKVKPRVSSTR